MAIRTTTNLLSANRVLVITADAVSSGELQWQDTGITEAEITTGTTQRYGPFDEPRQYTLKHTAGNLSDLSEITIYEGQVGMQCNLTTIPAGANLTIPPNSQVIIRDAFTLNGSLDLDGSLVLN